MSHGREIAVLGSYFHINIYSGSSVRNCEKNVWFYTPYFLYLTEVLLFFLYFISNLLLF